MHAIRIHKHGGPEVLTIEEMERPEPGPRQVLVEVKAAALNHLDLWVRNGLPGIELPLIPGSDASGEIVAVGEDVTDFFPDDQVVIQPGTFCGVCDACRYGQENLCPGYGILGETRDGVQAGYVALNVENVFAKPRHLTFEEAGSIGLVFLTAYQMLVKRAALRSGENVLIVGGNSGVGAAAIQIAKDLNATVIATASGKEKREFVLHQGADYIVDHYQTNWYKEVLNIVGEVGAHVVFEHVGSSTWDQSLKVMGIGARLVVCGATTGAKVSIHLRHLFRKNHAIFGSTMGDLDTFRSVIQGFVSRRYRPFVDRVLPYTDVADAHKYLESKAHKGKVVLSFAE